MVLGVGWHDPKGHGVHIDLSGAGTIMSTSCEHSDDPTQAKSGEIAHKSHEPIAFCVLFSPGTYHTGVLHTHTLVTCP